MIQTLPLEALEQNADNVYEAIIMISRRSRRSWTKRRKP